MSVPVTMEEERKQIKTHSPWIYSELYTSKFIQKYCPRAQLKKSASEIRHYNEQQNLVVEYDDPTSHLGKITDQDLKFWMERFNIFKVVEERFSFENRTHPLDALYKIKDVENSTLKK